MEKVMFRKELRPSCLADNDLVDDIGSWGLHECRADSQDIKCTFLEFFCHNHLS
jgi:hypothetical protein